jgi:hypothetical protein
VVDRFLRRLAEVFAAAGFKAEYKGALLYVADCPFDAYRHGRYANGAAKVHFLTRRFRVTDVGGRVQFDEQAAVQAVIAALPGRLAVRKQREDAQAREEFLKNMLGDSYQPYAKWHECAPGLSIGFEGGQLTFKFTSPDDATVLIARDYLMERFCE